MPLDAPDQTPDRRNDLSLHHQQPGRAAMKVALVTGAGRGLGFAIARRLAADGMRVVIADRAGVDQAADRIHGSFGLTVDLADPEQISLLGDRVLANHGRCDVLVNNAARLGLAPLGALDLETFRQFTAVNVEAPLLLCQRLLPSMAARGGGRVINVISNTIWRPPGAPGLVPYITTKSALLGLTRALAFEYGHSNVTVNAVAPGLTPTPGSSAGMSEEAFDVVRQQQAVPRTLSPDDIAGAVSYLASDAAALVSGQALRVDGGVVAL